MASRATWKGSINIGIVSLSVAAYKATDESSSGLAMRQLHNTCGLPINQKKWCGKCEQEVLAADIVKGYEVEKGKFVTFAAEELDAITPDSSHTIGIDTFVDEKDIDPMYFDEGYYITPQAAGAAAPFAMMREAMRGKVGIGTWTYSNRDHLVGVRPNGNGFVLHMLRLNNEIREMSETTNIGLADGIEVGTKELKLAKQLVEMYEGEFDPTLYKDSYREEFQTLLQAKIDGRVPEVKTAAAPKANVLDLMAALEASVKAGKPKKQAKVDTPKKQRKAS
jgi:DNA end-binding protein Ku